MGRACGCLVFSLRKLRPDRETRRRRMDVTDAFTFQRREEILLYLEGWILRYNFSKAPPVPFVNRCIKMGVL